MYDLLNTQACLSRQKEHLQLPERHLLHPGAWLFRVLCVKKYWALLALTETLGSWGGSEFTEDAQTIAEDAQHLTALGTVDQTLSDAHLFLGTLRKMVSLFPCCPGAALTPFCARIVACLFAVEGKQSLTRRPSWAPLCSELLLRCHHVSVVQWSAPFCWVPAHQLGLSQATSEQPHRLCQCSVYKHARCIPGTSTGDGASWHRWLPS